jgi:hypothetical protein
MEREMCPYVDGHPEELWIIVPQSMFQLREINQMEREMSPYVNTY